MVSTELTVEVQGEVREWGDSLAVVQGLEIVTAEDFAFASDLVKGARSNWKRLDERRTAITKPLLESKGKVDALFKPALDKLRDIETILKSKLGAYTVAQRLAQEQAMLASAEQFQAGGIPTAIFPEVPQAKGVSVKETWDFTVTDPLLVPREYCTPDPDKIKAAIWYADTRQPPQPIPGVSFHLRTDTVVRVR